MVCVLHVSSARARPGVVLMSFHQVIKTQQRQFTTWVLTDEGQQVADEGSHEVHVFLAVNPTEGTPQAEVMVRTMHQTTGWLLRGAE